MHIEFVGFRSHTVQQRLESSFCGIGLVQKEFMDVACSDRALDLMKAIKASLDPKGILNPGKIFPS